MNYGENLYSQMKVTVSVKHAAQFETGCTILKQDSEIQQNLWLPVVTISVLSF